MELKLNDLQYVACVWVFMTVSSQTPGTHLSGAALVRVLRQLHVGPHRPGRPLFR